MARLFGLIGNRADLVGRVLATESDVLRARKHEGLPGSEQLARRPEEGPLGWGMGFYQSGEVLMRRRPLDDRAEIDVAKLGSDVRADVLLAHVRSATVGALRTENTHPFRYRQWLFAATGTLPAFDELRDRLIDGIPEFLRSGIRGETDSEILFHVFLSFLHDANVLADGAIVSPRIVKEALRSTFAMVDAIASEVGAKPAQLNVLVTDGESMVGVHRNGEMAYRVLSGQKEADALIGDDLHLRRKTPELAHMHFVLVASDFDGPLPPRWKVLPASSVVLVARDEDPAVDAL